MIDNNKVVEVLRSVQDPRSGQDIITAKLISDLKIQDGKVYFALDVTGADSNAKMQLHQACIQAIQGAYDKADVHIHMKSAEKTSPSSNKTLPQVKNIIAIGSGKGGVGKSTVSVNTALALKAKGFRVGLLDADIWGPSIPTMMNLKGERPKVQDVYGKHKLIPIEQYGIHVISIGFIIEAEQAVVLRGPRLGGVIKQFINDTIWPELDYLIIDLPPGTGDIQLTLVQTVPVTGAVIVTTPQEVAVADAVKAMNMFMIDNIAVPILGIVENMSWFTPAELPDNKYYIFGKGGGKTLAKKSKSMILGKIPLVTAIRENSDAGMPSVQKEDSNKDYYMTIAENLVKQVELRNELYDPTRIVEITTR